MWPSGGQTRVARPLATRCSTFGGGRSDLGYLVTGGGGRADAQAGEMPECARPVGYVPRQTHTCDAAVLVRRDLRNGRGAGEHNA